MTRQVPIPAPQPGGLEQRRHRISVSVGPGQHAQQLLSVLGDLGLLDRVIRSWPAFTFEQWDRGEHALKLLWSVQGYAALVRLVWATWRRIPWLGRYPSPRTFLYSVFDRTAATHLGRPDLFLGWCQQSLHCLRSAGRAGAIAALEHPMLHVLLWQETMREEYARYAPDTRDYYSLLPDSLVRRMLAEYEAADLIVVPSSVACDSFAQRGVRADRIVTIPLGIDTALYASCPPPSRSDRFRVLYVGRLELLKGVHYLLEAWRQLGMRDADLVLAGPVLPEMSRSLARSCEGNVRVLGEVPHETVSRLLTDCDVVVFPSICDAFGLVILEAMAAGRPVIATTRSGAPDVVKEGEGFVIPPGDSRALRERLEWLCLHPEERLEMGRRARLKAQTQYGLANYRAALLQAYSRVLSSRGQAVAPIVPAGARG